MAEAVAGTTLVAGGAAALNQLYERDTDALMRRTRMRPLPAGRIAPSDARMFGVCCRGGRPRAACGAHQLAGGNAGAGDAAHLCRDLHADEAAHAALDDLGAVPGALPALIGWAASRGSIDRNGAALFAIVFCWQLPHFMAIAWLYREDYAKAGFPMLPVIDPEGRRAGKQAVYWAFLMVLASLVPAFSGLAGHGLSRGGDRRRRRACSRCPSASCNRATSRRRARSSTASITYLPLLWIAMVANKLMTVHDLPAVNASLNAMSGILLLIGYVLIRTRRIAAHRAVMIAAFMTSSLFLVCYVIYHAQVGSVPFPRHGFVRPIYFAILITHIVLAATVPPLAIVTLTRGLKGRYPQHRKIARWTFPIWMYVSVTGVLVYVLLYQPTWLL